MSGLCVQACLFSLGHQVCTAYLDVVISLLCCKLSVVIHTLALHLEQHGVANQAAIGFSLLHSCLELNDSVFSFLAIPAACAPYRFWLLHSLCYDNLNFCVKSWHHQPAQCTYCKGPAWQLAPCDNKTKPSSHAQCISLKQARASATSKHFSFWLRIRASFLVEEVQRGFRGCPSELRHSRSDALVQVAQPVMEQAPLLLVQCCQHLNIITRTVGGTLLGQHYSQTSPHRSRLA